MSEKYEIDTRLLGKEDIDFDDSGTNQQSEFTDLNGEIHPVTKLNATHIPLQANTRSLVSGATNVDKAVENLAEMVHGIETQNSSAMTDDTSITLSDPTARQAAINAQLRNLGGHTLTFLFPASVDVRVASSPLVFSGFYNGKLVVNLNNDEIADNGTLNKQGVFRIENCHCEVVVTNGTIKYLDSNNHYGIALDQVPNCSFESITFKGANAALDYAVYSNLSNFLFSECSFDNTKKFELKSVYSDYVDSNFESHNTDNTAHSALFSAKASLHHTHGIADLSGVEAAGSVSAHNSSATAHNGKFEVAGSVTSHNSNENAHSLRSSYLKMDLSNLTGVANAQAALRQLGLISDFNLPSGDYSRALNGNTSSSGSNNKSSYLFLPIQAGNEGHWVPLVLQWGYTDYFIISDTNAHASSEYGKYIYLSVPVRTCLGINFTEATDLASRPTAIAYFNSFGAKDRIVFNVKKLSGSNDTQFRFHYFLIGVYSGSFESLPFQYPVE